jgi:hypothetical protein
MINITRLSNQEKDLEILILRQQLSILQRKHNFPIKPKPVEKVTLAVLTANLNTFPTGLQINCEMSSPSSNLKLFFAGTANWFAGNGPTHTRTRVNGCQSANSLKNLNSALLERIPVGDTEKSSVNLSN